jgi:hypothetical protein
MTFIYKIEIIIIYFVIYCYLSTSPLALNCETIINDSDFSCRNFENERIIEEDLTILNSKNYTKTKFESTCNKTPNLFVLDNLTDSKDIIFICIPIGNNETKDNSLYSTIVGGLLAISGGFLIALWNSRNESKRMKFEWRKFLFEKYEKNYRDFIKDLDEISSVTQLEKNYQQLLASSFIPLSLKTQTENAIKSLKDESLNDVEKSRIRVNLVNSFAKFIQDPMDFS